MSTVKLSAASGSGSVSLKGPASSDANVDLLDTSGNLNLADDKKLNVGDGDDLAIYHSSSQNYLKATNGRINLRASEVRCENADGSEVLAKFIDGGACELRYNDAAVFQTLEYGARVKRPSGGATTLEVYGCEGQDASIQMAADDGDDNADYWQMTANQGASDWRLYNYATGSWQKNILAGGDGGVNLYHQNTVRLQTYNAGLWLYGDMLPGENNKDIGSSSSKWDDIHANNGTIQTSDRNEKNTIADSDLGLSFVNKLKPVSYKFNTGTRTHYGLIAQDVETTLSDISKPTSGFAGFIKEDTKDILYEKQDEIPSDKNIGDVKIAASTVYGLRYSEFIAPLIKSIQELSAEVDTLKTEKTKLQTDLTALTERVAALEAA